MQILLRMELSGRVHKGIWTTVTALRVTRLGLGFILKTEVSSAEMTRASRWSRTSCQNPGAGRHLLWPPMNFVPTNCSTFARYQPRMGLLIFDIESHARTPSQSERSICTF